MNKQVTAVKQIEEGINDATFNIKNGNGSIQTVVDVDFIMPEIVWPKQDVFRSQIIQAYERGLKNGLSGHDYPTDGDEYFNETYEKDE